MLSAEGEGERLVLVVHKLSIARVECRDLDVGLVLTAVLKYLAVVRSCCCTAVSYTTSIVGCGKKR